jgi:hypothetical protein
LNRPIIAALVTALLYGWFVITLIHARDNDVSRFVVAGGPGVDASKVPPGLTVRGDIGGYDGTMFYRLALNPFTREVTAHGISLDNPAYRQQRIGYPLLAWIVTAGRPPLVPWALLLINFAGLIAIAWTGARIAMHFGASASWGLLFAAYPGFLMTISRDLSEIAACAFLLAAVLAVLKERPYAAAALLTCAILTREMAVIAALALLVRPAWRKIAAIPLAVCALWELALWLQWGVLPLKGRNPHFTIPFTEFGAFFAAAAPRRIYMQRLYFAECVLLALLVIVVVLIWRRSQVKMEWRVAWIGYLILFATLPHDVWTEDFGFLRILGDFFVMSALLIVASTSTAARWVVLVMTLGVWQHLARHIIELR